MTTRHAAIRIAILLVGCACFSQQISAEEFRHSHYIQPDPFAYATGTLTAPISEHSLQWPLLLRNYLWYTGDETYVHELVGDYIDDWAFYFRTLESEVGVLAPFPSISGGAWIPNAQITNLFYYHALETAAALSEDLGRSHALFRITADTVKRNLLRDYYPDGTTALPPEDASQEFIEALALATAFGVLPPAAIDPYVPRLNDGTLPVRPELAPYLIEALFRAGHTALANQLLSETPSLRQDPVTGCAIPGHHARDALHWCNVMDGSPAYLYSQFLYGLRPTLPGWKRVEFTPTAAALSPFEIAIPDGRITIRRNSDVGYTITGPPEIELITQSEGVEIVTQNRLSHANATLSSAQLETLRATNWQERVGDAPGIWISADDQMLRLIQSETILFQMRCATALNGIGSQNNSLKTPAGWHVIAKKIGEHAPWGQIFRARRATESVWKPGDDVAEDLVLTRVLLLDGLEPGLNKGGEVDSMMRHIYIHGTNDEARIGTPSSHGCIRLLNDDIIELFQVIDEGTPVVITAGNEPLIPIDPPE